MDLENRDDFIFDNGPTEGDWTLREEARRGGDEIQRYIGPRRRRALQEEDERDARFDEIYVRGIDAPPSPRRPRRAELALLEGHVPNTIRSTRSGREYNPAGYNLGPPAPVTRRATRSGRVYGRGIPSLERLGGIFLRCCVIAGGRRYYVGPEIKTTDNVGGCRKKDGVVCKLPRKFFQFEGFNPKSDHNNCGLNCLRHLNTNLPSCHNLRKLLGVQPKVQLKPEHLQEIARRYNMPDVQVFTDSAECHEVEKALRDKFICLYLRDNHYVIMRNPERERAKCPHCLRVYKDKHKCSESRVSYAQKIIVKKAQRNMEENKTAYAFFDFETRLDPQTALYMSVTGDLNESTPLADRVITKQVATLCCLYFEWPETNEPIKKTWLGLDCLENFLDYLYELHTNKISLNLMAHNGSRFDSLILLGAIKKHPRHAMGTLVRDMIVKTSQILKFEFYSHIIRDTCCFLPASLESLCAAYGVEEGKITTCVVDGVTWRTKDICLMLPRLKPKHFVKFMLMDMNADYRQAYEEYCMRDCIALHKIWTKFTGAFYDITKNIKRPTGLGVNSLDADLDDEEQGGSEKDTPHYCDGSKAASRILDAAVTIPGASMRLFRIVNSCAKQYWAPTYPDWKPKDVPEDYVIPAVEYNKRVDTVNLLNDGIVGGISHVVIPGHHHFSNSAEDPERIALIDVVSLYVWSMLRCSFPEGIPLWSYDPAECEARVAEGLMGVFHVEDVVFNPQWSEYINDFPDTGNFRKRDWRAGYIKSAVMTNIDIVRIRSRHGQSLKILKGMYWRKSYNPFIDVLTEITDMKKQQDVWKEQGDPQYNPSIREVCKLLGNSLYGKMMERTKKFFYKEFDDYQAFTVSLAKDEYAIDRVICCNKRFYVKESAKPKNKIMPPLQFGVFILAHTRNLMQCYFDIIGRGNVIATETDSIYCREAALLSLKNSTHPTMRLGKDLGNMAMELNTIVEGYFLSKKCYAVRYEEKGKIKEKMRLKGVPGKFLRWDGYEQLFHEMKVTYPMRDPATGQYYPLYDKSGFREDGSMIMWQRTLFRGTETGVYMRKTEKTITADSVYFDVDYSRIGLDKCPVTGTIEPSVVFDNIRREDEFHNYTAKERKSITHNIKKTIKRKRQDELTMEEVDLELNNLQCMNNIDVQERLMSLYNIPNTP